MDVNKRRHRGFHQFVMVNNGIVDLVRRAESAFSGSGKCLYDAKRRKQACMMKKCDAEIELMRPVPAAGSKLHGRPCSIDINAIFNADLFDARVLRWSVCLCTLYVFFYSTSCLAGVLSIPLLCHYQVGAQDMYNGFSTRHQTEAVQECGKVIHWLFDSRVKESKVQRKESYIQLRP